jgi:hypothetical protein
MNTFIQTEKEIKRQKIDFAEFKDKVQNKNISACGVKEEV